MPLRITSVNACAALGGKLVDYSVLVVAVVGIIVINIRNKRQH